MANKAKGNSQLGKVGEELFGSWCTQADCVVNPGKRDERGWDLLVALPRPDRLGIERPADREPGEIEAYVQVKTSQKFRGSVRIKLSNWKTMIDDPRPAFVAFVETAKVNGVHTARSVRLLTVGRDLIERVVQELRRRSVDAGPAGVDLSNVTIPARLSESLALSSPFGKHFVEAVQQLTNGNPAAYAAQKARWREDAGSPTTRLTFSLDPAAYPDARSQDDLWRVLGRHLVGLEEEIEVDIQALQDVRFDIAIPLPDAPIGRGRLRAGPIEPLTDGEILLRSYEPNVTATLPVKYFTPLPYLPDLPESAHVARAKHSLVEVIHHDLNRITVQLHLEDASKPLPLRDLVAGVYAGMVMAAPGRREAHFRIGPSSSPAGRYMVDLEDTRLPVSPLKELEAPTLALLNILRQLGLEPTDEVVPALLLRHAMSIQRCATMLDKRNLENMSASVTFVNDPSCGKFGVWTTFRLPYGEGLLVALASEFELGQVPTVSSKQRAATVKAIEVVHFETCSDTPGDEWLASRFLVPALRWFQAREIETHSVGPLGERLRDFVPEELRWTSDVLPQAAGK